MNFSAKFLLAVFAFNTSQAGAQEVGNITPEQQQQVRTRVESLSLTSLSFGPGWADKTGNDNMYYSLHLGRNWEASVNAEVRLNFDAALPSEDKGGWLGASIGGGWLFLTGDVSPVIGAEFGYGYSHVRSAPDASGFLVGGYAGVRFLRTANVQMSLEGFIQSILDEENPILSGLRFGILF